MKILSTANLTFITFNDFIWNTDLPLNGYFACVSLLAVVVGENYALQLPARSQNDLLSFAVHRLPWPPCAPTECWAYFRTGESVNSRNPHLCFFFLNKRSLDCSLPNTILLVSSPNTPVIDTDLNYERHV